MNVHTVFLLGFALSVGLATVAVVGRLLWCTLISVRARNFRAAILSVIGLGGLLTLLAMALTMWFVLAVSHQQKDVGDTYAMMAVTGIPYFLAAYLLWRLASRLSAGRSKEGH